MGVKYARPAGITILSILGFLVALFLLAVGAMMIDDPSGIAEEIEDVTESDIKNAGYVTIAIGIFALLMAIGFWLTLSWARALGILITLAVIVFSAYQLYLIGLESETYGSVAGVVIGLIILGYLLFDKDVKLAFSD
ncbi:MAG: DUF2127 domain-containing protein [Candidatus Wukongarchaeota archaeon]|nr:DUF2127 domain-containing protein [Candidatus Wukongarchaeota archaeon]